MRRRLYFLLPNVESVRRTVDELLLARIDVGHIHVMAKEGMSLQGLPEANILQKSDLVYGFERGLLIGGFTGMIAGAIAVFSTTLGFEGGAIVLACAFAGGIIGAWASGMIGSDVINSRVKPFEKAIQRGEVLLMVDVPKEQVDDISNMITRQHPEAHDQQVDPTIPAFP